jgi:hypothetical protein
MQKRKPGQPHKGWKSAARKRSADVDYVKNLSYPEYNDALKERDAEIKRLRAWMAEIKIGIDDLKAQNSRLRHLLTVSLDEHDLNYGRFAVDYLPSHWTHRARAALNIQERTK